MPCKCGVSQMRKMQLEDHTSSNVCHQLAAPIHYSSFVKRCTKIGTSTNSDDACVVCVCCRASDQQIAERSGCVDYSDALKSVFVASTLARRNSRQSHVYRRIAERVKTSGRDNRAGRQVAIVVFVFLGIIARAAAHTVRETRALKLLQIEGRLSHRCCRCRVGGGSSR